MAQIEADSRIDIYKWKGKFELWRLLSFTNKNFFKNISTII